MPSMEIPLNRLLLTAPPGQGKTTAIKRLLQLHRPGGVLLDPLDELELEAGQRWDRRTWSRRQAMKEGELGDLVETLKELPPGHALVIDEANRFLGRTIPDSDPLLSWLDTARNQGCPFVLADKRPVRLHPLITDLADVMCYRPWRSAAARNWLQAAGADPELPVLPQFDYHDQGTWQWYVLMIGGDVGLTNTIDVTSRFATGSLTLDVIGG